MSLSFYFWKQKYKAGKEISNGKHTGHRTLWNQINFLLFRWLTYIVFGSKDSSLNNQYRKGGRLLYNFYFEMKPSIKTALMLSSAAFFNVCLHISDRFACVNAKVEHYRLTHVFTLAKLPQHWKAELQSEKIIAPDIYGREIKVITNISIVYSDERLHWTQNVSNSSFHLSTN